MANAQALNEMMAAQDAAKAASAPLEVPQVLAPYMRSLSSSSSHHSLVRNRSALSEADPADFRPPNTGWSTQLEFFFTCLSYAIGLGNVWRFPYLCYKNGGGAFLLPYCIMLILVGLPVFLLELSFGQFAALGPLAIWTVNPLFKGLGYGMVSISLVIGLYYNVIISQCALFFFMSMRGELPWDSCGNDWNTLQCTDPSRRSEGVNNTEPLDNTTFQTVNRNAVRANFTIGGDFGLVGTKTEEFYFNFVLHQSPGGIAEISVPPWPLALCFLLCWMIIAAGLIKGSASLGKISYFTAIFPYVMLTVLFVRSVMLPGAGDGILFYLTPNWTKLQDIMVWQEAATQIFFNMGCANGALITMASFNNFKNNCLRDAIVVPVLNALTSIFAGLVVFSILGFMAYTKNTTVDKVASGGPGLAFIVYPEALAQLPIGPLWSVLFFLMMVTLGFGSELSFVETVLTAFQDDLHEHIKSNRCKYLYRIAICVICFLLGLPMICRGGIYVLQIFDFFISFLALLMICLIEIVVVVWLYGFPRFRFADDMAMMIDRQLPPFFRYMMRYVTPLLIFALLIASVTLYEPPKMDIGGAQLPYPGWALGCGWFIAIFPVAFVPAWMAYYHCYLGGYDSLREHIQPMINWGPREHQYRFGAYAMQTQAIAALQALREAYSKLQSPQQEATEPKNPNTSKAVSSKDENAVIDVYF